MTPPAKPAIPARILIRLVRLYRATLSHWLGGQCRFHPTCSAYAIEALHTHGAIRGSRLAISRILRCHPWAKAGFDPVPKTQSGTENTQHETFEERTDSPSRK